MINLFKMDLYRMFKARSFKVWLLLAFLLSFSQMPLLKAVSMLLSLIPGAGSISGMIPKSANLSSLIGNPFPGINFILMMFSACYFFYADLEHGFIKNIAGQMPKKGYTVLSKYLAAIVHNLIFIAAGIIGNLIGHLLIVKLIMDKDVMKMTGAMCVRFLLVMALTAILLLVVASVHSKTFGMEDRARLMENLMVSGSPYEDCYKGQHVQEKLEYYFRFLRDTLSDDTLPAATEWEKALENASDLSQSLAD